MTPKQEERIRKKIKRIKAALAADKKMWGGYHHDGSGLRYSIPALYVKIGDYSGGLRYFTWFNKYFPNDAGYPDFLFEWTLILFKTKRIKEAERKAFQTFCSNVYVFDKFFGKEILPIDKWEGSNVDTVAYAHTYFNYSASQGDLSDFAEWLKEFISSDRFLRFREKYIDIQKQLKIVEDYEKRSALIEKEHQLIDEL